MVRKNGKKSSGQREEQAVGGQPLMKTVRQQHKELQKQHEAPPVLSGGCVAGPSQQSQGQRDQGPQYCSQPQNQQPMKPPTYDAGRGRGQGNPRAGTVKQQTGDADVAAITRGIQTLKIPNRTGCGTKGRKTVVETNYLSLDLSTLRNKIAIHYDVEFKPSPFPKRLLRRAMEEFRRRNFPDRYPAFDGRKNLYSTRELPEKTDRFMVQDDESVRVKECEITIKYTSQVNLESLSTYMSSERTLEIPQKAIQAVDVVLRNAPSLHGFVQVGRSFYTPPSGTILKLGDGLEMWYGMFQSATLGWKPFVNIDVTHKGFPSPQNVVDAIYEICRPQDNSELNYNQKEDFKNYISDLKVDYMIPNNPTSKRTFRVNAIAECPAKLRFQLDDGQRISVQEYFTNVKRIQLRFPHLPCLHVGSLKREKPIYLPPELCSISKHQVINKKMSNRETSAMIRHTATSTDKRKQKIMDMLRSVRFNEDPCVREFGLSVGGKFEEVSARILDAPKLEYENQRSPTIPRSGVWRASNFVISGNLKSWIILNLDSYVREDALGRFGELMQKTGKNFGMNIARPLQSRSLRFLARDTSELQAFFTSMKQRVDLIVVVIPNVKNSYAKVKQIAELNVGVLTQCIKSTTMQRMNEATCSNILLKVNSKLNGVNHTLSSVSRPPFFESPVMIVGADVTHPSPDQKDIPSVVAVCASHDPKALFKYNIQIRLQPPKVEIIQDLEAIIRDQLLYFRDVTRYLPNRIIFYRDGVSEGEFAKVLNSELTAVRRACSSVQQGYKPMVTFLVVQKRHHTRFFPTRREDEDGKNRNVPPGTVVDSEITHPVELDFFLVSHASIQGVSRPTKYHLLWNDDNNMTTDDLEQLTYYLCHMFSRCTRSVSYPVPTYNAHLAASRARVYLDGRKTTLTNLANEQRKYFESSVLKAIIKDFPMYFV